MTRVAMWLLLAVVAAAAAVLSFAALRDLALTCGFDETLAPLLPVVIDAGAAAGCMVWLSSASADRPKVFARSLTFVLLASSVAGNAIVHGLFAYHLAPPWWLVVAVSGIAPAVLGAVVHLAVLVGRTSDQVNPADPRGAAVAAAPTSPVTAARTAPRSTTGAAAPASVPVVPKPVSVAQGSDEKLAKRARKPLTERQKTKRREAQQRYKDRKRSETNGVEVRELVMSR